MMSTKLLAGAAVTAVMTIGQVPTELREFDSFGPTDGMGPECCEAFSDNDGSVVTSSTAIDCLFVGFVLGQAYDAAERGIDVGLIASDMRMQCSTVAALERPALEQLAGDVENSASPEEAATLISQHLIDRYEGLKAEVVAGNSALLAPWSGTWETTYGTMVLQADSSGQLLGSYGIAEYELEGQLNPHDSRVLEGTWTEGTSTGRFRFTLNDAASWQGVWSGSGAPVGATNWTGTRLVDASDLASWVGTWSTSYGPLEFQISSNGRTVTGNYGSAEHAVVGWIEPGRPTALVGYWQHNGSTSTGRFLFEHQEDGRWAGAWSWGDTEPTGVNWSGERMQQTSDRSEHIDESIATE